MTTTLTARNRELTSPTDRRRWRWAGGFALAHIVVLLGAVALEGVDGFQNGTSAAKIAAGLREHSVAHTLYTTYAEATAFFLLVPAVILFGRLFGRGNEMAEIAARCFVVLGGVYVAATLAIGWAPLQAAAYGAHHGVAADVLATVNDIRNYDFVLQVAISMALALALGIAAIASRQLTRWVGYGGTAAGAIGILVTPFAHNAISMVWMIWWVGLSVLALRGGPRDQRA